MKNEAIVIVALCIILLFLSSVFIYEWKIFYKAVNERELKPKYISRAEFDILEWDVEKIKYKGDFTIYLEGISGNLYIINEKGDTVYRHIKED